MPMRPELSRKAISPSPSSIRRSGSPSATSSDDRQAGSQYCRISVPIGVPGPTRVSSSFSACEVIAWFLQLSPSIGAAHQLFDERDGSEQREADHAQDEQRRKNHRCL